MESHELATAIGVHEIKKGSVKYMSFVMNELREDFSDEQINWEYVESGIIEELFQINYIPIDELLEIYGNAMKLYYQEEISISVPNTDAVLYVNRERLINVIVNQLKCRCNRH